MPEVREAILILDLLINCALGYFFVISALLSSAFFKQVWLEYNQFLRLVQFHEAVSRSVQGERQLDSISLWDHLRFIKRFIETKYEEIFEMGNNQPAPKPTEPPKVVEESSGFHLVELHYTSIGWSLGALVFVLVVVVAAVMLTIRLRDWCKRYWRGHIRPRRPDGMEMEMGPPPSYSPPAYDQARPVSRVLPGGYGPSVPVDGWGYPLGRGSEAPPSGWSPALRRAQLRAHFPEGCAVPPHVPQAVVIEILQAWAEEARRLENRQAVRPLVSEVRLEDVPSRSTLESTDVSEEETHSARPTPGRRGAEVQERREPERPWQRVAKANGQ